MHVYGQQWPVVMRCPPVNGFFFPGGTIRTRRDGPVIINSVSGVIIAVPFVAPSGVRHDE